MVSIITASFNKQELIADTISSVLQQSYTNWELIIVDDASTDSTQQIIAGFAEQDKRIVYVQLEENKGANFCRNKGLALAKGQYIIFLDADDVLAPNCIEHRIRFAASNPGLDFSVHTMAIFQKQIGDRSYKWVPKSKAPLDDFLAHNLPWQTMQPFWSRQFLLKINGFDEDFKRLQDVELHTRALLQEHVKYKLCAQTADCFYRIDEERKNFSSYEFMRRWVQASVQYCRKFEPIVPSTKQRFLLGTILRMYIHLLNELKVKRISIEQFATLEADLLEYVKSNSKVRYKGALFTIAKVAGKIPARIPGINWILLQLIII